MIAGRSRTSCPPRSPESSCERRGPRGCGRRGEAPWQAQAARRDRARSGLAGVADAVRDGVRIPYKEIPGFPEPGAPGHKGELVGGTLEGVPVVVQSGRFHLYEGHAPDVAALPTRVFAALGATRSWSPTRRAAFATLPPTVLMLIADHINLMFKNPLVGPVAEGTSASPT